MFFVSFCNSALKFIYTYVTTLFSVKRRWIAWCCDFDLCQQTRSAQCHDGRWTHQQAQPQQPSQPPREYYPLILLKLLLGVVPMPWPGFAHGEGASFREVGVVFRISDNQWFLSNFSSIWSVWNIHWKLKATLNSWERGIGVNWML